MTKFYSNDDNPNIVIRFTEPAEFHVIRKNDKGWAALPADNSYMRELFLGQGNNCMTEISRDEAKKIVERLLSNDIHCSHEERIETLFPSA